MRLSEASTRDFVLTPTGRMAQIVGLVGERFALRYLDDNSEVQLLPELCKPVPKGLASERTT